MPIARAVTSNWQQATATSTTPQCVKSTAPVVGNVMMAAVGVNTVVNPTTINGWTRISLAFNNTATDAFAFFYKVVVPGDTATYAPCTLASSQIWVMVIQEFSGLDTTAPLELQTTSLSTLATKTTAPLDPPDGVERLVVGFCVSDGSRTFSTPLVNGTSEVHGGGSFAGPTNTGISIQAWDRIDGSTVAGSYTTSIAASAADDGAISMFIFKPAGPTTLLTPPFVTSGSVVYAPSIAYNALMGAGLATATAAAPAATVAGKTVLGAGVATATAASAAATITTVRTAALSAGVATATAAAPVAAFLTYTPGFAAFRIGARASLVGLKAIQATTRLAGTGRLAVAGRHGGVQPVVLAGSASLAVAGRRGGLAVAAVRAQVSIRPTAVPKASLGLTALRVRWRAAIAGTPVELPKSTNATVILSGRVSGAGLDAVHEGTGEAQALWTRLRVAVVGRRDAAGDVAGRATPWADVIGLKAVPSTVVVAASASSLTGAFGGHLGLVALRGAALVDVAPGVRGALNTARFWADLSVALTSVSDHPPLGPFGPLVPQNLGHVYRGDTLILPVWQAQDQRGIVLDLTESTLWFTAKINLDDADADLATIQCISTDGSIVILDAQSGFYQVTVNSNETWGLPDDTVFRFDVQVESYTGRITTVKVGTFTVVRDVTRAKA